MREPSKGLCLGIIAALLAPAAALASDIRITPVTVEARSGARNATVTVVNGESRPLRVQFRVMGWSQEGGEDMLIPTDKVVVSPPQAVLEPNRRYTVRLVRTAVDDFGPEEAYRLFVDEIPDRQAAGFSGVTLAVQQRLPVFFSMNPRSQAIVDWSIDRRDGRAWLRGTNRGNGHLRVSNMQLRQGERVVTEVPGLVGYILPGSTVRWPINLPPGVSGSRLQLEAQSNGGRVNASLTDGAR